MQLLDHATLSFDDTVVFNRLDFNVKPHKITCLLGPSGCGKTSILNLIAGLIAPSGGRVLTRGDSVGYVFQDDRLLPWRTVYQNVSLVGDDDESAIRELLSALAIDEARDKYPHQLSGGMRQRVAIARAFYFNAPLLLMDEPYKSLDYDLRIKLLHYLIRLWQDRQNTILFVTHDIDEALLLGHAVILLSRGPATILSRYELTTAPIARTVSDALHIDIRRDIITKMTSQLYRRESS